MNLWYNTVNNKSALAVLDIPQSVTPRKEIVMPTHATTVSLVCEQCGSSFQVPYWVEAAKKRRFCSKPCQYAAMRRPVLDRFYSKVDRSGDCWIWLYVARSDGYGSFYNGSRTVLAHRFSYELFVGPIPVGLQIDHLCRVRHCVNPAHLEAVTSRENTMRGLNSSAVYARRTHCNNGHPFDEANTHIDRRGGRVCRACLRAKAKANRERKIERGLV